MDDGFTIRPAVRTDAATILGFIRELAEYEKLLHEVVADVEAIEASIFDRKEAEVVIAELDGKPVGHALFFHNYSTFLGRHGLYIEDLYVRPAHRGKGFGKKLLAHLAALAVDRGCGRLEWWVLDWNKPAIDFYEAIGAKAMDEWTVYRLTGDELGRLAGKR